METKSADIILVFDLVVVLQFVSAFHHEAQSPIVGVNIGVKASDFQKTKRLLLNTMARNWKALFRLGSDKQTLLTDESKEEYFNIPILFTDVAAFARFRVAKILTIQIADQQFVVTPPDIDLMKV